MPDVSVRLLERDQYAASARLVSSTMLASATDETALAWVPFFEGQTTHGAFDESGSLVGVCRWFATDLSFAGPSLPAAGVTAVAVLGSHRRRGHLRRLMHAQLASIVEAEVPIALLVAAEWPIYGRYGYGPAVGACGFDIDATTARFRTLATGSIELLAPAELRPHLEAVHDLRWARTLGAVKRHALIWDLFAGTASRPGDASDPGKKRGAIWRDAAGTVLGAVAYSVEESWTRNRPTGRAEVDLLVGATPEAERELWRHVCETDWITTVHAGGRGLDDPLPHLLHDGRAAAQIDRSDCIWARVLDVPRVLGARRAPVAGQAVIEVFDDLGYAEGRWSLDIGPDGAEISASSAPVDVRLPASALGAACLGGTAVATLHDAGWIDEGSPGGVARLDALLHAPSPPWSPTTF